MRTILSVVLCGIPLCLAAGCTHMVESRVVQAFAESLQEHDAKRLKAEASSEFEDKALKGDETFRALKLIKMPEGMPKVISVKDIRDESGKDVVEKRVVAAIGKEGRKVAFRLTREGGNGHWVVDDVFLSKEDYGTANKSVATRLAVLLSLQESLDAWKSGDRSQILAAAAPEFAQALSELTPEQLTHFAKTVTSDMADVRILPDERVGPETAELRLARDGGELVMQFRRFENHWKLDDLALEAHRGGQDIASARHVAAAMASAFRFQGAFRGSDKRTLAEVCTPQFFKGSLATADLGQVKLPEPSPAMDDFDMKLEGAKATFVIRSPTEMLKISLAQQPKQELHSAPRFLVDEVTIYDLRSAQDKRLSSLFTAHATMERFAAALAAGNVANLKRDSTHDFNQRAWENAAPEQFESLPMTRVAAVKPHIVQTRFKGSLTEVLVEQGDSPLTYVLRDEGGRMLVDDVLVPAHGWPESMKTTLDLMIPVLKFAAGLSQSNLDAARDYSSGNFNHYVWNHFDEAIDFEPSPESFLNSPLASISLSADRADVVLGNRNHGAKVFLIKEQGHFRVDDVSLVFGPGQEREIHLKRAIRMQISEGDLSSARGRPADDDFVQPASATE